MPGRFGRFWKTKIFHLSGLSSFSIVQSFIHIMLIILHWYDEGQQTLLWPTGSEFFFPLSSSQKPCREVVWCWKTVGLSCDFTEAFGLVLSFSKSSVKDHKGLKRQNLNVCPRLIKSAFWWVALRLASKQLDGAEDTVHAPYEKFPRAAPDGFGLLMSLEFTRKTNLLLQYCFSLSSLWLQFEAEGPDCFDLVVQTWRSPAPLKNAPRFWGRRRRWSLLS